MLIIAYKINNVILHDNYGKLNLEKIEHSFIQNPRGNYKIENYVHDFRKQQICQICNY